MAKGNRLLDTKAIFVYTGKNLYKSFWKQYPLKPNRIHLLTSLLNMHYTWVKAFFFWGGGGAWLLLK